MDKQNLLRKIMDYTAEASVSNSAEPCTKRELNNAIQKTADLLTAIVKELDK